jgi:CRP-like cAMP-binding protein
VDLADNLLFRSLPAGEREQIAHAARVEEVQVGDVVFHADDVRYVFFPQGAVISLLRSLTDGASIEIGMIGYEGVAGINSILGAPINPHEGVIQGNGRIARIDAAAFRAIVERSPAAMSMLLRFVATLFSQTSQLAACNRLHLVSERLAHWLLLLHDRVSGDEMSVTQEFLARMLGTRRAGINESVRALTEAGAIEHQRNRVRIVDRAKLEELSCECYEVVVQELETAMGYTPRKRA